MSKKTCPAVLDVLQAALREAGLKQVTDVFVWVKFKDETTEYEFAVDDTEDLIYELGTVIINERCAMAQGPEPMAN